MNHIEYLKTKYKHAITPIEYTIDEFLEKIKEKIDIKTISTDLLSPIYFQITKENACHCILNAEQQINTKEVDFIAFEVLRNKKSEEYYCDDMTEVLMNETILFISYLATLDLYGEQYGVLPISG